MYGECNYNARTAKRLKATSSPNDAIPLKYVFPFLTYLGVSEHAASTLKPEEAKLRDKFHGKLLESQWLSLPLDQLQANVHQSKRRRTSVDSQGREIHFETPADFADGQDRGRPGSGTLLSQNGAPNNGLSDDALPDKDNRRLEEKRVFGGDLNEEKRVGNLSEDLFLREENDAAMDQCRMEAFDIHDAFDINDAFDVNGGFDVSGGFEGSGGDVPTDAPQGVAMVEDGSLRCEPLVVSTDDDLLEEELGHTSNEKDDLDRTLEAAEDEQLQSVDLDDLVAGWDVLSGWDSANPEVLLEMDAHLPNEDESRAVAARDDETPPTWLNDDGAGMFVPDQSTPQVQVGKRLSSQMQEPPSLTLTDAEASVFWGVVPQGKEHVNGELQAYVEAESTAVTLVEAKRTENDPLLGWDAAALKAAGFTSRDTGKLRWQDFQPNQKEVVEIDRKIDSTSADLKAFDVVESSMKLFRHLVSDVTGPSVRERRLNIERVLDPSQSHLANSIMSHASILRSQTNGKDTSRRVGHFSFFAHQMPMIIKRLSTNAANKGLDGSGLGNSPGKRGRKLRTLNGQHVIGGAAGEPLRMNEEEALKAYSLWACWRETALNDEAREKWSRQARDIRSFVTDQPVQKLTQAIGKESYMSWINDNLEEQYAASDPFVELMKPADVRGAVAAKSIQHAAVAFEFLGLHPKPTAAFMARVFQPDFRTGLYHAHYFTVNKTPFKTGHNQLYRQPNPKRDSTRLSLDLAGGRNFASPAASTLGVKTQKPASPASSPLFGTWVVSPPRHCPALDAYKISATDPADPRTPAKHAAMFFDSVASLSLGEWCHMALFEHSTTPPVQAVLGMGAKVVRFYRPSRETFTNLAQAERKLRGRLGPFGALKILGDRQPTLFGGPLRVKPNQGVSVFKSDLLAGLCFTHPFDPKRPLPTPTEWRSRRPATGRATWGATTADYRLTDFLLIRHGTSDTASNPYVEVTLRPLFLESTNSDGGMFVGSHYGAESSTADLLASKVARVGLYSLGQCELLTEIPTPEGKKMSDLRKEWLKAHALRLAMNGISDFQANKQKCLAWFSGVLDSSIIHKALLTVKNTGSDQPSSVAAVATQPSGSLVGGGSGTAVKVVSEQTLRRLIVPEQVCGVAAAQLGVARLAWAGVKTLRSIEKVSVARHLLYFNDIISDQSWARAVGIQAAYAQLPDAEKSAATDKILSLPPPFRGGQAHLSTCASAIARFIEELVLTAPWNLQKGFTEVTSKKSCQFLLNSTFEPSMGRNEALFFLKEDISTTSARDPALQTLSRSEMSLLPSQLHFARSSAEVRASVFEPGRRQRLETLSTAEIQLSLLRAGLNPNKVAVLTRSELINLAFRFQFLLVPPGFMGNLSNQPSQLDQQDYHTRVNEVLMRQRGALQNDDFRVAETAHDVTDVFEEIKHAPIDDTALEESLLGEADQVATKEQSHQEMKKTLFDLVWRDSGLLNYSPEVGVQTGVPLGCSGNLSVVASEARENASRAIKKTDGFGLSNPQVTQKWLSTLPSEDICDFLKKRGKHIVPRLKWVRQSQQDGMQKVVYIYGAENIVRFVNWRRRRCLEPKLATKTGGVKGQIKTAPKPDLSPPAPTGSQVGAARETARSCRRCGQVGHIASNPVCPLFNVKKQSANDNAMEDEVSERETEGAATEMRGGLPVTAVRLTARQQRSLYDKHRDAERKGTPFASSIVKFVGSIDQALDEFNSNLGKIISGLRRPEKKFDWFWEAVREQDAPRYYELVKEPMWLNKILNTCAVKKYTSLNRFVRDVELIRENCYTYNPEGHWIRPIAANLVETVSQKLEIQKVWLQEVESVISAQASTKN